MKFADHFSGHADKYAEFRPRYPDALFRWIADESPRRDVAWDCGTGNGQAALSLAELFARVEATDPSKEQIARATQNPKIHYSVAPAEESGLAPASVDAITSASAAHWFDLPRFYAEVRRVARPGALIALFCYQLANISPEIDAEITRFYQGDVGEYWPPERQLVEDGYRTIPFPFPEIGVPVFTMEAQWTLDQLIGYLDTWSATQRARKATGKDPLAPFRKRMEPLWGDGKRRVHWPITPRAGRVS